MIDRRRDPTADTGLFDLIYRQTLPRVPPYLGMNLSVRGRRIFKTKHKLKAPTAKPKEFDNNAQLWLNRKHEFVKADLKRSLTAPTNLPKLSPGAYKGPVIEDLIDDLSKSVKSPKIVNMDSLKVPKSEAVKKKGDRSKRERVSRKRGSCKSKINRVNFISRKPNAKENIEVEVKASSYLGIFNEWASRNHEIKKENCSWERETASILKGKNVGAPHDPNKNSCKSSDCFHLDKRNLLPQIKN